MAATTVTDVPGVTTGPYVPYLVKSGDAVVLGNGLDWYTTAGQVTISTTATSGKCAGIAVEAVSATESTAGYYLPLQIYGVAMVTAGGSTDWVVGSFAVFEGSDGYMHPAGSTANTLYMTHGIMLNQPDTDLDYGMVLLNLNVPYYASINSGS
jgi:hypothetical protein